MSFPRGCGLTEFDFYEKVHEDDEKIIYDDIDTHFYKLPKKNNKIKVVVYDNKRQVTIYKNEDTKKNQYTKYKFNRIIRVFDSFSEYKKWSLVQNEVKPKFGIIYDTIIATGDLLEIVHELL